MRCALHIFAAFALGYILPVVSVCVFHPSGRVALRRGDVRAEEPAEHLPPVRVAAPPDEWGAAVPCRPDAAGTVSADANIIWGGVIDRKVLSKPRPSLPRETRGLNLYSTVAVVIVVDGTGRVIVARPLSGHPLLRTPAARAACEARFSPMNVNGVPPLVSGILTYDFGR